MNLGPKSLALSACLCFASVLSTAQGTPCGADGTAPAQGSPIACVTGDGVQVTEASTPAATPDTLTPEQRPASAPIVTYIDGKLAVTAKNSTLGDVLRAISAKTGASIDIPEAANERVVSQLGPASTREVMTALLNGSHFNYVMVGSENNPNAVAHVILTAKTDRPEGSGGGSTGTMASATRASVQPRTALQAAIMQPYQQMLEQQQAQQAALEAQQQAVAAGVTEAPAPAAPPAEAAANQASGGASSEAGVAEVASPPPSDAAQTNNNSGEKSPQQVLQNLYETRRQMIQAQHQPPPPGQQQ